MGYNTTLMILNDGIEAIERDLTGWWERVKHTIQSRSFASNGGRHQIGAANHANVAEVVSCEHSSATQVVAVGGNYANLLGVVRGADHHTEAGKLAVVRLLAEQLGYELVPKKKGHLSIVRSEGQADKPKDSSSD